MSSARRAEASASLAGIPPDQARHALTQLTGTHLLAEHAPGRYAFHDLLREYAAEQARDLFAAAFHQRQLARLAAGDEARRHAARAELFLANHRAVAAAGPGANVMPPAK